MAAAPVSNMGKEVEARYRATANGTALTSGVMTSVSIYLNGGQQVKNVGFVGATTAAGTPTHWGYAVYSTAATPALLGSTGDLLTAAFAANTYVPKALTATVVIPKAGYYWLSMWMAATTVPTLLSAPAFTTGLLNAAGIIPGDVALAVTSGTGLTTAPPATIATPTTSLVVPIAYVS